MADGTLRLSIDIEPRNAQAAFALFGAPGRAVALAALKDGAGAVKEPEPGAPKGGEWAKLAGMWCADPDFWLFLNMNFPNDTPVQSVNDAAMSIRVYCGIESRAELDHNPDALHLFNQHIRFPFMKWMQARGIRK
ncbi:MAG: hypothetical protein DI563_02005 [Variovorax paradoxus]|uniref:Uncharacterized protein n=1 Tax=Variovorax paradoxus TaxID=34073 RepID=A0A2W5QHF7_VARPD|nr:MAG: hypothetical protein DI563_02005 [Variovorax paradoxus]